MAVIKHRFSKDVKLQIKKLYVYDNYHGIFALLINLFWIVFAVFLTKISFWLFPFSLLIIGSRQRALATILHEAGHGALFKSKRLEKVLGTWFSGYLIFQGWVSYRKSHNSLHHHKLGNFDYDPDFIFYKKSGLFDGKSKYEFIFLFFLKPLFFLNVFSSVRYLFVNRLAKGLGARELISIIISQLVVATIFMWFDGVGGYFLYWLLPYFTVFQALTWFIEFSEHYPMIENANIDLEASRNRFSHPVEQFFTGMHGENFHLIHHLFPAIPFWNLKKAHLILLQDDAYALVNAKFGGIFFSSNFVPSIWEKIFTDDYVKEIDFVQTA